MHQIYTLRNPENLKSKTFGDGDENTIYVGTPFYGELSKNQDGTLPVSANKVMILDLNVISDIRSDDNKKNVSNLLNWALKNNISFIPSVALSEQQRYHEVPAEAFKQLIDSLNNKHGFNIPKAKSDIIYNEVVRKIDNINHNTELLKDYLVLIKNFYHKKYGLKRKIEEFSKFIREEEIPVLGFAFVLGCTYFHAKENKTLYSEKLLSKIQKDMDVTGKEQEKKLWNVAADFMLFMAASELFVNELHPKEYNISYIASKDITVSHALNEICYASIVVNNNVSFCNIGLRPDGTRSEELATLITKHLKQSKNFSHDGTPNQSHKKYRAKLKKMADELIQC